MKFKMTTEQKEGFIQLFMRAFRSLAEQIKKNYLMISIVGGFGYKILGMLGTIAAGKYAATMNDIAYAKQGHVQDSTLIANQFKEIAAMKIQDTVQDMRIYRIESKMLPSHAECYPPYFYLGVNPRCEYTLASNS